MNVLGFELSQKADTVLQILKGRLKKPLVFAAVKQGVSAFGQCDIGDPDQYLVYLNPELPKAAFEVNLLHEVMHAVQDSCNYPFLQVEPVLPEGINRQHICELQHEIQSRILDVFVIHDLKRMGISSEYFISYGYSRIINAIQPGYDFRYVPDEADFAMKLFYLACVSGSARTEQLRKKANQYYPGVFGKAFALAKECKKIGFSDAASAARVEAKCFSAYDLWGKLMICNQTDRLTRPDDLESFLQSF